jgi:putative FmdB family regulatory protein
MPTYAFACKKCKKEFTLVMRLSEREKTKVQCLACKSDEVALVPQAFSAKTSRKS